MKLGKNVLAVVNIKGIQNHIVRFLKISCLVSKKYSIVNNVKTIKKRKAKR